MKESTKRTGATASILFKMMAKCSMRSMIMASAYYARTSPTRTIASTSEEFRTRQSLRIGLISLEIMFY